VAAVAQPKQSSRNRLLRALTLEDFALVGPHLEPVELSKGKILIEPNQSVEYVTFPECGVASVVALNSDHRPVEISIVGWEGLVGPSVILGVDRTPHRELLPDGWSEPPHRHPNQHLPGDKVWLVGEHRSSGERKDICPTCCRTHR